MSSEWPTSSDPSKVSAETTDGRFVRIDHDEWWDTTGIDIVPQWKVDLYLEQNPGVGLISRSR